MWLGHEISKLMLEFPLVGIHVIMEDLSGESDFWWAIFDGGGGDSKYISNHTI